MNKPSSATLEEASTKAEASETVPNRPRKSAAQRAHRSAHANGHAKGATSPARANGARNANGAGIGSRDVLRALIALKKGNFSVRLPVEWTGTAGKIADTFNEVAESMEQSTEELNRISRLVGKEGKINERLSAGRGSGAWQERVDSVNTLLGFLVHPISETARVIGAVAKGDLSQTMATGIARRQLA